MLARLKSWRPDRWDVTYGFWTLAYLGASAACGVSGKWVPFGLFLFIAVLIGFAPLVIRRRDRRGTNQRS